MRRTIRENAPHNLFLEYPNLELQEEVWSDFQHIAIYIHHELGKILVHDDVVMFVEAYEASYHEMIAHVPLLYHPNPKRVLVIGGGDGGTSREVLRHAEVEQLIQVEIDREVIRLCQKHFPEMTSAVYNDPRMELQILDGVQFIADCANGQHLPFDIILIDSTDPQGPATRLFTEEFYRNCSKSLSMDGILVLQGETFYGMADIQKQIFESLCKYFCSYGMYTSAIPFYPLGTWNLIYASQRLHSDWQLREDALQNLANSSQGLFYLNREIISACFALPNYALRFTGLNKSKEYNL